MQSMVHVQLLFLLGTCFISILYGVQIVQSVDYYLQSKHDKLWVKSLVTLILLLSTFYVGLIIPLTFNVLVPKAPPLHTNRLAHIQTCIVIAGIIPPIVQYFFFYRINRLIRSRTILILTIIGAFTQTFFAIMGITAQGIHNVSISKGGNLVRPVVIGMNVSSVVNDIFISAALIYTLHKTKTGFAATDDLLHKIIRTTIQTGLVTSCLAIVTLIFFFALPGDSLFDTFMRLLPLVYANTLLSSLNARYRWEAKPYGIRESNNPPLTSLQFASNPGFLGTVGIASMGNSDAHHHNVTIPQTSPGSIGASPINPKLRPLDESDESLKKVPSHAGLVV